MNYWWEVDGIRDDLTDPRTSSSEIVQAFLPGCPRGQGVQPHGLPRPRGRGPARRRSGRKAIAVAGDRDPGRRRRPGLVDALGFDPVVAGHLPAGVAFEPGTELFGADVGRDALIRMIERFPDSDRGREVAAARATLPARWSRASA